MNIKNNNNLKKFHGISSVSGILLMMGSFIYNNLEYEIFPGIGDFSIVIGFFMVISKTLFGFLPRKIKEYFTTLGALMIMGGYLYNILIKKLFFEAQDIPALIGFSLIQLAILTYIIIYIFDYIEYQQLSKMHR